MSIQIEILGQPQSDNALYVEVDSGNSISRLLFDCGEGCLSAKPFGQVQKIDHAFFSHFHMDHISGFDSLFRCVYAREQPVEFWGPKNSSQILNHRFQGFWWNLVSEQNGSVIVNDIDFPLLSRTQFELRDGFSTPLERQRENSEGMILDHPDFEIRAIELNHAGPVIGYRINEKPKTNVDMDVVRSLGFSTGPWLKVIKENTEGQVEIDGQSRNIAELRELILTEKSGDSVAYLTDFLLDEATENRLIPFLRGCGTVVCEAQYRKEDLDLALKNFHTTTDQVSKLAAKAKIQKLVLFHLSDRYLPKAWSEMLAQAQENFHDTSFPIHWLNG